MPQLARQQLQKLHGAAVRRWVLVQINDDNRDMTVDPGHVVGAADLAVVKVLAPELAQQVDTALHDRDDIGPVILWRVLILWKE